MDSSAKRTAQGTLESVLVSQGVTYSLVEVAQQALNALLLPLFFFFLTAEDFGAITWALVFSQFTMLLSTLGLDFSLLRRYYLWPPERRIALASGVWVISLAWSAVIGTLAFLAIRRSYAGTPLYLPLLLGSFSGLVAGLRNIPLSIVRVTGAMRVYAAAELGAGLIRAVCQAVLILAGFGATGYMGGFVIGSCLTALVLVRSSESGIRWREAEWRLDPDSWRYTWQVLPSIAIIRILGFADRILLFHWAPLDTLGVYGAAMRFTTSLKFVTGGFKLALAPAFSRAEAERLDTQGLFARLSRLMLLTMLLAGSGVMLLVWTVQFTPWATRATELGQLSALLLLAQFLGGLAAIGHVKLYYSSEPQNSGFVAAANAAALVMGAMLLVPLAGAPGAAVAQVLAAAVSVAVIAINDVRLTRQISPWHQLFGLTALFVPTLAAMWLTATMWQLLVLIPTFAMYGIITAATIHQLHGPALRQLLPWRQHA